MAGGPGMAQFYPLNPNSRNGVQQRSDSAKEYLSYRAGKKSRIPKDGFFHQPVIMVDPP